MPRLHITAEEHRNGKCVHAFQALSSLAPVNSNPSTRLAFPATSFNLHSILCSKFSLPISWQPIITSSLPLRRLMISKTHRYVVAKGSESRLRLEMANTSQILNRCEVLEEWSFALRRARRALCSLYTDLVPYVVASLLTFTKKLIKDAIQFHSFASLSYRPDRLRFFLKHLQLHSVKNLACTIFCSCSPRQRTLLDNTSKIELRSRLSSIP